MSQIPIVKQASILGSLAGLAVIGIFIFVGLALSPQNGILYGVAAYFVLRLILRTIPSDHRTGITKVREQQFSEAMLHFQRSFDFFENKPWLDDYRALFLLSPSAISYREMALANLGFCYAQFGDGPKARHYYEQCLERFPDSLLASSALAMLDSGAKMGVG